jgi:hypothetical protein
MKPTGVGGSGVAGSFAPDPPHSTPFHYIATKNSQREDREVT